MTEASLIGMPPEVIRNMMKFMKVSEILNLCETSKHFNQFCNDENLWRERVLEFYQIIDPLPGKTWRETFIDLFTNTVRRLDISVNGVLYAQKWAEVGEDYLVFVRKVSQEIGIDLFWSAAFVFKDGTVSFILKHGVPQFEYGYFHDFPFEEIIGVDISNVDRLLVRIGDRTNLVWITPSTTIGEFYDRIRKLYPGATKFIIPSHPSAYFPISDDPAVRSREILSHLITYGMNNLDPPIQVLS